MPAYGTGHENRVGECPFWSAKQTSQARTANAGSRAHCQVPKRNPSIRRIRRGCCLESVAADGLMFDQRVALRDALPVPAGSKHERRGQYRQSRLRGGGITPGVITLFRKIEGLRSHKRRRQNDTKFFDPHPTPLSARARPELVVRSEGG